MTTRYFRLFLRSPLPVLALLAGAMAPAQAQSVIYKCTDDQGRVEFTDSLKRGCKVLDVPGVIPAPPPRKVPAPARIGATALAAPAPSDFPKVDNAQQRARDNDRREILNDELRSEEKKLTDLKRDFNNGEPERNGNERNYAKYQERVLLMRGDVQRAEKNVEALKREIANIK